MKDYMTLAEPSFGYYEEKRSKFISGIYPCTDEATAAKILAEIKSNNFGANHNVYAYILKNGTTHFSDDGEPHGTAGKPVLEVLSSTGLTDVLLVVTRYFGGVLLGTGGLVRAYTASAKDSLNDMKTVKMCVTVFYETQFDYTYHDRFVKFLQKVGAQTLKTDFAEKVTACFIIEANVKDKFLSELTEEFASKISVKELKTEIYPHKIK